MGRVAIIEDVDDNREFLALLLSGEHAIVMYADGATFIRDFRSGQFDVVLLDVLMPDMDGFEVLRQMRIVDSAVRVVAVTADAHEARRAFALAAGFDEYITKPILNFESFKATVHAHCHRVIH